MTFPPLTLFLAGLTSLRCDFGAQVAPTWTPGPSLTLEKPRFSLGFYTFQTIITFAIKLLKRPSAGPVRRRKGPSRPPLGATLDPQTPPKQPQSLNVDVILVHLSHICGPCCPNCSQACSWTLKSIQMYRKNISEGSKTDTK